MTEEQPKDYLNIPIGLNDKVVLTHNHYQQFVLGEVIKIHRKQLTINCIKGNINMPSTTKRSFRDVLVVSSSITEL